MKWLVKPFFWLLTSAIPVFIAACYGAPGFPDDWDDGPDPEKSIPGRVLSALTGSGIPYIRVSCLLYGYDDLEVYDEAYSAPDDGAFELWSSEYTPCEVLRFEDVDGEENGAFQPLETDYADDGQPVVVQLLAQD